MSLLLELNKDTNLLSKLSRPVDEAVFTVAILRKTDCADISSLNNRIICQKVVYFSNRLGISPKYEFNIYVHGPYSTKLSDDLFALSTKFTAIEPAEFISEETKTNFEKLKIFLASTEKNPRLLEIAATLDFFNSRLNDKCAAKKSTEKIKKTSKEEIILAEKALTSAGLW